MLRAAALIAVLGVSAGAAADEARYLVAGELLPDRVVANGFVQQIHDRRGGAVVVSVSTSMHPLEVRAPYAGPPRSPVNGVPPGFELPRELYRELGDETDAYAAATRVLAWVAEHLRLENDGRGPQDAAAVLQRRAGRCSGLANAAAALLMTAGFQAHTVSGLLVSKEGPIPHRWVSCMLPGAGWVMSDPTLGLWVVTTRHLAFGDTVRAAPAVHVLSIVERELATLPLRGKAPIRPNLGSTLVCRLEPDAAMLEAVVTLSGAGGQTYRARLDPEASFHGLQPGHWEMVVTTPDGRVDQRHLLELEAGQVHSMTVTIPKV